MRECQVEDRGVASQEGFETAAGRTTDPSTALRSGRDDKGEGLLFGRVATWMDGVRNGYTVKTADAPLRYAAVLLTDGRVRNEVLWWASPIVFGPRTPVRTWGTRVDLWDPQWA
jgi:hypothetical protein